MVWARKKRVILFTSFSVIGCLFVVHELASYSYPLGLRSKVRLGPKNTFSLPLLSVWQSKPLSNSQLSFITMTVNKRASDLSILGEWLRSPEETPPPALNYESAVNPGHRLLILVWKYGPFLDRRHVRHFATRDSDPSSPWQGCSVKSCDLSYRDEDLARADAVIFHLHMTKGLHEIPSAKGKPGQIWIFLTDESPINTFRYAFGNRNISQYDRIFDWSMTYREHSDVPVPYGRTMARRKYNENERRRETKKRKNKLVAILGSNCSGMNERWEYVKKLKSIFGEKLDIYGRCLGGNTTVCPGHFDTDCPVLGAYKFYLAFENSNCREYITEKVFWNAYEKGSVPIIMGAPRFDCERLLPPRSFIHVADFASPNSLANYLLYLDIDDDAYDEYHAWRSKYIVVNEHGYFGSLSRHYCRACEALRYNIRPPKLAKYQRIGDFLNAIRDCDPYRDV